jgi:hypothetical protein
MQNSVDLVYSSFLVFVFSPRCSKPVFSQENIVPENSFILCAAFVPHFGLERTPEVLWQEHSQLYFLDSDQVNTDFRSLCIHKNTVGRGIHSFNQH